ncbi:MAG: alpha-N-acetylglucosaminidase [Bacteroidales bacterium]|nr:alpha-N-acetylglucosaminidase [Bacteroidales bacterium]
MKKTFLITVAMFAALLSSCRPSTEPAREVIEGFAGEDFPVKLSLCLEKKDGCDRFTYSVENGMLHIDGSSNLALCRGFYEYVKSQEAGICSWSGNRFDLPAQLEESGPVSKVSPFRNHYYFNVVTYGYTMAYWDWERWSREIDWMALHGMDMPLALVANEAITARVWKKLGLSDEEIADYFVGPAHFPWMRMGNISHHDGPLPEEWHEGQVELMHRILDKMRALGMSPICPAFAGFVPQAIKRLYPDLNLMEMSWSDGAFHNWMIDPQDELFARMGRMFIEEWEKEFGKCGYYLADSFNEMDIPFPEKGDPARYELLADYGEKVYGAIKAGNPDAVWVMQGWMFGYQHDIWDYETLAALVSRVPDDKMLLLDLAADYNRHKWHTDYNWEYYKGFFGKQWVYSVIPNMGGKTCLTGKLDFYANGRLDALNSANRGNLAAFGFAPEGIENNEVIYELLCDAGWTDGEIRLDEWLDNYSACRYGAVPQGIKDYWKEILQGPYGDFRDHPRYVWQFRPGLVKQGSALIDEHLFDAVRAFASASGELARSPLYATDLEELTALYLGARMEQTVGTIYEKVAEGSDFTAEKESFLNMGAALDRALASHPNLKLENWIGYARAWGSTPELADYYEHNAKRLVTIWGPPVDDYSARVWSGLVRDYYLPRWQKWFEAEENGTRFDFTLWEEDWVRNSSGTSPVEPFEDPVEACVRLVNDN